MRYARLISGLTSATTCPSISSHVRAAETLPSHTTLKWIDNKLSDRAKIVLRFDHARHCVGARRDARDGLAQLRVSLGKLLKNGRERGPVVTYPRYCFARF